MLQIKNLTYYQSSHFFPFLSPLVSHPLHRSFLFSLLFDWLPTVDLIEKRAHITLEILKLQNVAFRNCLFGRAPLFFVSYNQMDRAIACCLQFYSPRSSSILPPPLWSAGQT